jgi:hypothetical protein
MASDVLPGYLHGARSMPTSAAASEIGAGVRSRAAARSDGAFGAVVEHRRSFSLGRGAQHGGPERGGELSSSMQIRSGQVRSGPSPSTSGHRGRIVG